MEARTRRKADENKKSNRGEMGRHDIGALSIPAPDFPTEACIIGGEGCERLHISARRGSATQSS